MKLTIIVESGPKTPFSRTTYRSVGEGDAPFPGLLYFNLDTYFITLSEEVSNSTFWVFGISRPVIETRASRLYGEQSTHKVKVENVYKTRI